jgi:hypothetical protein
LGSPGNRGSIAKFSTVTSRGSALCKKSIQGGATEREPPIRVGSLAGSLTQRLGPVANSENYKETELERRDTFSKKSHNEYIRVIDNTVLEKDNQ